jgi:vacuolar-type H+-ATPase subunit C/Vma6
VQRWSTTSSTLVNGLHRAMTSMMKRTCKAYANTTTILRQQQNAEQMITTGDKKHDELIQAVTETRQRMNEGTATEAELHAAQNAVNEYSRAKTAEMQRAYMARVLTQLQQ